MSIEDILTEWKESKACKRLEDKKASRKPKAKAKPSIKVKRTKKKVVYSEYIVSDAWNRKRKKILGQRGNRCEFCRSSKNLQLHHLTYARLGHERASDLQVLCRDCHASTHENKGAESSLTTEFVNLVRD
jgi:5-methylcytosine-specific restriction endonuclease McrA